MKKIISALCVFISILAWIVYFVRTSQISTITDFTGLLLFVPALLAIPGVVFAWLANKERKSPFTIVLIVLNTLFLFSIQLIHFVGTLILGV